MKQSHLTTPRTMAECQFQTGYTPGPVKRGSWLHAIVTIVCMAAIGAMLAWRG